MCSTLIARPTGSAAINLAVWLDSTTTAVSSRLTSTCPVESLTVGSKSFDLGRSFMSRLTKSSPLPRLVGKGHLKNGSDMYCHLGGGRARLVRHPWAADRDFARRHVDARCRVPSMNWASTFRWTDSKAHLAPVQACNSDGSKECEAALVRFFCTTQFLNQE